jgi:ribose transport system permease protein
MSAVDTTLEPRRDGRAQRITDLKFQFSGRYRVVWIGLAALLILSALTASALFNQASISFVTGLAGVLAIAAAGQLLVIMTGGIDLSVPAVMTIGGAILVKHTDGANGDLVVAILMCLAAAAVFGLINGILVTFVRLNAMIVTLAMNGVGLGVVVLWATTTFSPTGQVPGHLVDLGRDTLGPVSVLGIAGLVVLCLLGLGLRSTSLGRSYVAMGSNRVAAEIIGVRVRTLQMLAYVVAALLYMVAGILLAGIVQTPNVTVGDAYQLSTIVAVALGGASLAGGPSSMLCTAAGCLFVTTLNQYLDLKDFDAGVKTLANGVVLVVAVAMVTVGAGGRMRFRALGVRMKGLVGR